MEQLNIFQQVKQAVPIRQAASFYGLKVGRDGMCRCPFHNDRTPSMKFYGDHYYCFGCGESGDVITLTGRLLQFSPLEAARRLAGDFHVAAMDPIPPDGQKGAGPPYERMQSKEGITRAVRTLLGYRRVMDELVRYLSPPSRDAEWSDAFSHALSEYAHATILLDRFLFSDKDTQHALLHDRSEELFFMQLITESYDKKKEEQHNE